LILSVPTIDFIYKSGIVDPRTGKPVGADDAFFTGVNNELADKGFLVTAVDDLITWARTGSLMGMSGSRVTSSRCLARLNGGRGMR
jgi:NADH-quinone oxidoreductase subunit B